MTGPFDGSFEALMAAAEKVDGLFRRKRSRWGILAALAALLLVYALAPGPSEPGTPCPPEKTADLGLSPPLWWVGGGPETPVLSSIGLDPNSRIDYQLLLGAAGEDMTPVGRARGGREMESLSINLMAPLAPGTVYRWQVVAENRIKKRAESRVWTFSTRALPEIESFEAGRSLVDLGDPVTLRWSVANAREAEIEPGVGPVPLRGEMSLAPQENVTYTLSAKNFAGTERATVEVLVTKPLFIDSMAGGWSTLEDGKGSVVRDIKDVVGIEDNATRISYDMVSGGWVGIAKTFSLKDGNESLSLAGTDGISFFSRGGCSSKALEIRIVDKNGTARGRTWDEGAVSSDWTRLEAGYEELGFIKAEGSEEKDAAIDIGNVTVVYFIVADRERQEFGSSGWIEIDDLEAFHRREGESGA